ncbi:Uncharacterised protein [Vibrio cholerae]|nr:Uncharacterised protein [Vibrio cholerae]
MIVETLFARQFYNANRIQLRHITQLAHIPRPLVGAQQGKIMRLNIGHGFAELIAALF